jgi:hypothetical protein
MSTQMKNSRWILVSDFGKRKNLYRCECGTEKLVNKYNVISGRSLSCGCLSSEVSRSINTIHGKAGTAIYCAWASMRRRCYDKKNPGYVTYGARGISVCGEWKDFEIFRKDMEPSHQDGLYLDRINPTIGYFKDNCRWVDSYLSASNIVSTKRRGTIRSGKKYASRIRAHGVILSWGCFEKRIEAHYNFCIIYKEWFGCCFYYKNGSSSDDFILKYEAKLNRGRK